MKLVDRVKRLLLTPRQEWEVIDAEPTTPAQLYSGYVVPLAAAAAVAHFVGLAAFGVLGWRPGVGAVLGATIISFVGSLIGVYLLALIIDALAPTFDGRRDPIQALKTSAYGHTAAWVGSLFLILPVLGIITLLLALYSLYLLYLGLPVLMKAPREKAVGYTVVVVLAAIVLQIVVRLVTSQFVPMPSWGMR